MGKAFAAGWSADRDWRRAARSLAGQAREDLKGRPCHLGLLFVSEGFQDLDPGELGRLARDGLGGAPVLATNACGVIGSDREIEMEPALSLAAMHLPGVKVAPFILREAGDPADARGLISAVDVYPTEEPSFLCLADPMGLDIERLVAGFNVAFPGRPVIGGLSSGVAVGRPNWIVCGEEIVSGGAAGVALSGPIRFETVVSQGCRPVGRPHLITRARENAVLELAGRAALEVLQETVSRLGPDDQRLARRSLLAGLAMAERPERLARGDFLIRNLLGYDSASGALMVGASPRTGQTLQFHLRDGRASADDLRSMLGALPPAAGEGRGALIFSCCGRGKGLYGAPDHDIRLIQSARGPMAAAGFFANGEIGPVGGTNYLHGYTSSLVVLR